MFVSKAAYALLGAALPPRAGCQAGHLLLRPGSLSDSNCLLSQRLAPWKMIFAILFCNLISATVGTALSA